MQTVKSSIVNLYFKCCNDGACILTDFDIENVENVFILNVKP